MTEESGDEHQDQAEQNARRKRKIESEVVTFDHDITGQAPDVRDSPKEVQQRADHDNKSSGPDQPFPQGLEFHTDLL